MLQEEVLAWAIGTEVSHLTLSHSLMPSVAPQGGGHPSGLSAAAQHETLLSLWSCYQPPTLPPCPAYTFPASNCPQSKSSVQHDPLRSVCMLSHSLAPSCCQGNTEFSTTSKKGRLGGLVHP